MRKSMVITRATVRDAAEILAVQKLAYASEAEIYQDYSIPPMTETAEEIEEEFKRQTFLKVVLDGRLIASVRAQREEDTCYIGRLIVHPQFQNQGIGTRLMLEVENHFPDARRFELFTGHRSERNLHLYRKLGYQVFYREPVTPKLTYVFMEKLRSARAEA